MIPDWLDLRGVLLFLLVFAPLEHLVPIHRTSPGLRRGCGTDLLNLFLSGIFIRLGLTAVIVVSADAGTALVPVSWPELIRGWPIWLQVLLATVIADLGFYCAHRAMHAVPWLWHFHAVHHSSEKLDWLAAYRVHPVDQVLVKGASLVPIFVLGFSGTAIAIAALIYQWQAIVVRSNVRVPMGALRRLVVGPEFHHWHHADERGAHDRNCSGQMLLWDVVFRTLHLPGRMPARYGVHDALPPSYIAQRAYPSRRIGSAVRMHSIPTSSRSPRERAATARQPG